MPDTIEMRAMKYLYKKLKHARIALGKAEGKPHAAEEIAGLQNKIEVLEWLTDVALNTTTERSSKHGVNFDTGSKVPPSRCGRPIDEGTEAR